MCTERDFDRTGSQESAAHGWDTSPPPNVDSHGFIGVTPDFGEDSLWHRSLEERLYRELWEGTPGECGCRGSSHGDRAWEDIGRGNTWFRKGDVDKLARVLRTYAIETGVEIEEEAVDCVASCADLLWKGTCACKARALMDAVLELLSSRQAMAAWAAGERMGPLDSFTLERVTLKAVVWELTVLGCGKVLFSSDEWAYLQLLSPYGDPIPLAWMAEQLRCSPEWLSQYLEPSLIDLGLVAITAQGRLALADLPLDGAGRRGSHAWPHEATVSEDAGWGNPSRDYPSMDKPSKDNPRSGTPLPGEWGCDDGPDSGAGKAPPLRPGASDAPRVARKRMDRSWQLPLMQPGSGFRFGKLAWSTPDSGRTSWIVVEQNWGLARPG